MVRKGTDPQHTPTPDEALSADRGATHGNYIHQAKVEADLKLRLRTSANWNALRENQQMALEAICMKMSRVVCGDPNHADHWDDIAGYAKLGLRK
ncbi:MAG: hypothetical protein KAS36_02665 [Anaerolineales bacterium]|nr:hypothetical protein [Anaerolineales bacterium]